MEQLIDTDRIWRNKSISPEKSSGSAKNIEGLLNIEGDISELSGNVSWIATEVRLLEYLNISNINEFKKLIDENNKLTEMGTFEYKNDILFGVRQIGSSSYHYFNYHDGVTEDPQFLINAIKLMVNNPTTIVFLSKGRISLGISI